jgi:pilus assembly protein CpaB
MVLAHNQMEGHVRGGSIALLLVAVLMGVLAAFLARAWLLGQVRAANQSVGTIVVAAVPMQFGAAISEEKVTEVRWAADVLPPGAFATKRDLFKDGRRVALTSIERDEPVLTSKVTAPGQRGSLSTLLDGGKRAVTVRVDDVRGVAGFIQPNDRVDVVLIRTEGATAGQGYSDLILQNMKVLAIDQIAGQHQVEQASAIVKAVTLEVTPEEAQKLLLATNIGRLSLILRQPGEVGADVTRRITASDLAYIPEPAKVEAQPASAPAPNLDTSTVVIMRGSKRDEYSVPRY